MKIRRYFSLRSICLLAVAVIALAGVYLLPRALAQSQSGFQYNGIVHVSWW